MKVLGMDMKCVRHHTAQCLLRCFIHTKEIAHIHQQTKVGMIHRRHQLLHPVAVLGEKSMVLHHCANSKIRSIFRNGAASFCQSGQNSIKAANPRIILRKTPCGIVTYPGTSQNLRNPHFTLQALDLILQIAVASIQHITENGVVYNLNPNPFAFFLYPGSKGKRRFSFRQGKSGKFDGIKSHFLRFRDHVQLFHRTAFHQLTEAVGTDSDFHMRLPPIPDFTIRLYTDYTTPEPGVKDG